MKDRKQDGTWDNNNVNRASDVGGGKYFFRTLLKQNIYPRSMLWKCDLDLPENHMYHREKIFWWMFLSIVNTNFRRLTNNIYLSSKHVLNMVNRVMIMMKTSQYTMGQTSRRYISLEHETIITLKELLTWEGGNYLGRQKLWWMFLWNPNLRSWLTN